MLLRKKPHLYIEFMEKAIRYLAVDSQSNQLMEKDYIMFDTAILYEGKIINPALVENRLKALVAEKKWRNAKVAIILPNDYIVVREEEIPAQLTQAEAKDYIALHLNHLIRSPFPQTSFHFEQVEKDDDKQTVLLLLYATDVIHHYQTVIENSGLIPHIADISSLSLYRVLINQMSFDNNKHILLLQWHPCHNLITVYHNHLPKVIRHAKAIRLANLWELGKNGEWQWNGERSELEDDISELMNGLERFINFYRYSVLNGESGVTDVVLTGDFPYLDLIKNQLARRTNLPIHELSTEEPLENQFLPLYGLTLKNKKSTLKPKKGEGK